MQWCEWWPSKSTTIRFWAVGDHQQHLVALASLRLRDFSENAGAAE